MSLNLCDPWPAKIVMGGSVFWMMAALGLDEGGACYAPLSRRAKRWEGGEVWAERFPMHEILLTKERQEIINNVKYVYAQISTSYFSSNGVGP